MSNTKYQKRKIQNCHRQYNYLSTKLGRISWQIFRTNNKNSLQWPDIRATYKNCALSSISNEQIENRRSFYVNYRKDTALQTLSWYLKKCKQKQGVKNQPGMEWESSLTTKQGKGHIPITQTSKGHRQVKKQEIAELSTVVQCSQLLNLACVPQKPYRIWHGRDKETRQEETPQSTGGNFQVLQAVKQVNKNIDLIQ